jgi:NADPH-dependent 2,4-dienoyl-CoA reductase/sulfur reductase-like enzyme
MSHIVSGKPTYIPLGTTANKTGRIAGSVIGGEEVSFPGVLGSQVTKVFDLYIAGTGLSLEQARSEGFAAAQSDITKGRQGILLPGRKVKCP